MKTIGILSHSPEGAALCFLTCCEESARRLGPLMHPDIVTATATLDDCLPAYTTGDVALSDAPLLSTEGWVRRARP